MKRVCKWLAVWVLGGELLLWLFETGWKTIMGMALVAACLMPFGFLIIIGIAAYNTFKGG